MKKSTQSPKELLKKRVAKSKMLKYHKDECSLKMLTFPQIYGEKEIEPLNIKCNYERTFFKTRDRNLKEDTYHNPYAVPERLRMTTKCLPPRKDKPEPFILGEIHTVCDIDPSFYKIIEGRPVRSFCDIKVYMKNIRDITLFRANAAYLNDKIIQIESNFVSEEDEYKEVESSFANIKMYFVTFAEESYREAKRMQAYAEAKAQQLASITDKLEAYSFLYVKLKNMVSSIIGTYDKLLRYKKFLNSVAPYWWREQHEDLCLLGSTLCSEFFANMESEELVPTSVYKKRALSLGQIRPQLYFETPLQLITLLDGKSRQCLNYIEIGILSSVYLNKVNKYRKSFKKNMIAECTEIEEVIEVFKKKVQTMVELKENYKSAFEKLLESEFQRLFSSYESIKLFTCVQYVHTRMFHTQEDPNDTLTTLMSHIEKMYFKLSEYLDGLNQEVVKVAQKQIFSEDIEAMKQAYDAQRELKEHDVLCKALYKSFEPSRRRTRY